MFGDVDARSSRSTCRSTWRSLHTSAYRLASGAMSVTRRAASSRGGSPLSVFRGAVRRDRKSSPRRDASAFLQILEEGKVTDSRGPQDRFPQHDHHHDFEWSVRSLIKKQTTLGFGAPPSRRQLRRDARQDSQGNQAGLQTRVPQSPRRYHRLPHPYEARISSRSWNSRCRRWWSVSSSRTSTSTSTNLRRTSLSRRGYDPQYGARPMRRAVEKYLEDPMAEDPASRHDPGSWRNPFR